MIHRIEVYLPTRDRSGRKLAGHQYARAVLEWRYLMANLFGGYTAVQGRGGCFVDGDLVEEEVEILYALTPPGESGGRGVSGLILVIEAARQFALDFNQESVLVVAGDESFFVTAALDPAEVIRAA